MSGLWRLYFRLSGGSYFRRLIRTKHGFAAFQAALFLFLAGFSAWGGDFPVISQLDARDPVFRQYLDDVDYARKLIYGKKTDGKSLAGNLRIYSYTLSKDDDIFRLAARCNIPYAAIATLNRIGHVSSIPQTILIPTVHGIFIPEIPHNDLEQLMSASRNPETGVIITLNHFTGPEKFNFLPGMDFNPTERACFLNAGFHFPLQHYRISSNFGVRSSPFTGRLQNHAGLDLAAAAGSSVFSTREGTVAETGFDPVYGNYIIIAHHDNWVSLYGHLSEITISPKTRVSRDVIIGKVGSTGQSTGPHLHFEIRKNGTAMDPGKLLFK